MGFRTFDGGFLRSPYGCAVGPGWLCGRANWGFERVSLRDSGVRNRAGVGSMLLICWRGWGFASALLLVLGVCAVSTGPIEFLGEGPVQEVPDTEMGGADGLIQPAEPPGGARTSADGMELGHTDDALTGGEIIGGNRRAAWLNGSYTEQVTGVADEETIVDPVTGRVMPERRNVSGGGPSGRGGDTSLSDHVRPEGA